MTAPTDVTQLDALVLKVESYLYGLQTAKIRLPKDHCETLQALSQRLGKAVTAIPAEIEAIGKRWAESCKDGQGLMAQVQSIRSDIFVAPQTNRVTFARNIKLFFGGPQVSVIDSDPTKARKRLTRERCERIRNLRPDGIVSWAVAIPPSTWAANVMSSDTFDYLEEYIEPSCTVLWPTEIYDTLKALGGEEPLQQSYEYHEFLKGRFPITFREAQEEQQRRIRPEPIEAIQAPAAADLRAGDALSLESTHSQASLGVANFEMASHAHNFGQAGASSMNIAFVAILAEVDKLIEILGEYLFIGMKTCRTRHEEEEAGLRFRTNAVRLHPAYQTGGDFKLEVMLNFETGRDIWAKAFPRLP